METQIIELMKRAVEKRSCIQFMYQGYAREAAPMMLGYTRDGRYVLHAYQYAGYSSKGAVTEENAAWRFFYLDEIPELRLITGHWFEPAQKTEDEYVPPKFVTEVIALSPRE